jgi:predicted porin
VKLVTDPGPPVKTLTVGNTRSNFDGLSRNDRLRYDTPKFGGLNLSGSATNGDAYEVAARYSQEFGGFGKLAGAAGYVDTKDRDTSDSPPKTRFKQIGASLSWLHPSGINLTGAWGNKDPQVSGSVDSDNAYIKLGYKTDIHAFSVEWGQTDDLNAKGDESSNVGAAYVITPWKGVEFYAMGRLYELDRSSGPSIEDITVIMAGTRRFINQKTEFSKSLRKIKDLRR